LLDTDGGAVLGGPGSVFAAAYINAYLNGGDLFLEWRPSLRWPANVLPTRF